MDAERDTNTQSDTSRNWRETEGDLKIFSMESFRLIRKLTREKGGEERMKGVADELEAQRVSDVMTLLSRL